MISFYYIFIDKQRVKHWRYFSVCDERVQKYHFNVDVRKKDLFLQNVLFANH
jgi:hypothetical protein